MSAASFLHSSFLQAISAVMLWLVHVQKVPQASEHLCPAKLQTRGWYHGGRRPSSDDSLHSPTVIPPSTLDKPSIVKRNHRRRTCSHTSPRRSLVECRWLDREDCRHLTVVGLHDTGPRRDICCACQPVCCDFTGRRTPDSLAATLPSICVFCI